MLNDELLVRYDAFRTILESCKTALLKELAELLQREGVDIHVLSGRVKGRESLRYKLSRPDKTYHSLWDVTDLLGLRITTYFEDTIEQVAKLLEKHLPMDFVNSTDKLRFKDHGTFGYRSLHYVSALAGDRVYAKELPPEFRFEIQIRTVLQHAWAEVEHDLGYKSLRKTSSELIPDAIRRRFSRIASLLEVADEEFVSIRRDLEAYEQSVKSAIADASKPVPLDGVSLLSIINEPVVRELDEGIASLLGKELSPSPFFPAYLIKLLKLAGLKDTKELLSALSQYGSLVREIVLPYFDFTCNAWQLTVNSIDRVYRGYSLFFLSHIVVLQSPQLDINKVSQLTQMYRELDYPNDEKTAQTVSGLLFSALKNFRRG
ncbi:MAG: hypothetical protein WA705_08560 [Candidatus Ozemobacteraceae bacterium]